MDEYLFVVTAIVADNGGVAVSYPGFVGRRREREKTNRIAATGARSIRGWRAGSCREFGIEENRKKLQELSSADGNLDFLDEPDSEASRVCGAVYNYCKASRSIAEMVGSHANRLKQNQISLLICNIGLL